MLFDSVLQPLRSTTYISNVFLAIVIVGL